LLLRCLATRAVLFFWVVSNLIFSSYVGNRIYKALQEFREVVILDCSHQRNINFFFCASSSYPHKALLQAYLASDDAFKKLLENLLVGLTGDFTELLLLVPSYKSVF
jgi:hypothetical protein